MAPWPTDDQFPAFEDMRNRIKAENLTCMWYLPKKKTFCSYHIAKDDHQQLRSRVERLPPLPLLEDLEMVAESCCCARHHRDLIWGSGLYRAVALRWLNDQRTAMGLPCQGADLKKLDIKPVVFAKYENSPEETLVSTLKADLGSKKCEDGALYIYTYKKNKAFENMIKIGYTGRSIRIRLKEWAKCGQGEPELLGSVECVRHPERVEALTHFQLLDYWHRQRWCNHHLRSHVEWFKIDLERAHTIVKLWSKWMRDAEPYERTGASVKLKPSWSEHIDFLVEHGNPVTAEAMLLIHEIERDPDKLQDFLDNSASNPAKQTSVKEEDRK